ncbi:MAG: hypothetical protein U9O41_10085 [Candidatus Aerophobetes bacterium]|nr:hypothetical protein [Candidatus Aerophobetes bacterium]
MPKEYRPSWITEEGSIDPAKLSIELIESEFEELIEDKDFTYKKRNQFEQILEGARWKEDRS